MSAGTGDLISRIYGNFRGVDFRGEEVNLSRSPDAVNMWKDYRETESVRTRPALDAWLQIKEPNPIFHSMYIHRVTENGAGIAARLYVHCNKHIWCIDLDRYGEFIKSECLDTEVSDEDNSHFFTFGDKVYFICGSSYYWHSMEKPDLQKVEPYVPTTTIGKKPAGGGTLHEDVNMLTRKRINTFIGDGKSAEYMLDGKVEYVEHVKVNGVLVDETSYECELESNSLTFHANSIPPAPNTDGQDNVEIRFRAIAPTKWGNGTAVIFGARCVTVFDNRVFVGGSPLCPNVLFHSSLDDPTYFSDQDYYEEGKDNARINGLVAGNNALWVFRNGASDNSNVFYHVPTIDDEYGKIYPSTHSNISAGCVGKAINFNDDIVFFSDNGMEGITGDITTEQMVSHRSSLIDRKMMEQLRLHHADYEGMVLAEFEGYLIAFIGKEAYLADSRAVFTNGDHTEYEWYYWKLPRNVKFAQVYNSVAYIMLDDLMIYKLDLTYTETDSAIASHWVTPKDKFNAPHLLKTTNKRGCVVEATGDITVSAKVDGGAFEKIGEYMGVEDYFVSRIKRKKFKDIQLKFSSDTRFALETATLEAFVGGYIKR